MSFHKYLRNDPPVAARAAGTAITTVPNGAVRLQIVAPVRRLEGMHEIQYEKNADRHECDEEEAAAQKRPKT